MRGIPNTAAGAYIDDFNFSCPPEHAPTIISRLTPLLSELHLELAPNKCGVLWPQLSSPPSSVVAFVEAKGYKLHTGILPILGSAIGLDQTALGSFATTTLNRYSRILNILSHPTMPSQHAFAILRLCHVSTINFLLRTLPSHIITPASPI